MKSGVTEVFLVFFEGLADAFLLGDVPAQFFHVTFRLFRAFALQLGAFTFGLFSLRRGLARARAT